MRTSEYTENFDMERFVAGEPCEDRNGCIRRGVEETRRGVKYMVNGYDNYFASRKLLQSSADKQGWKMKPVALKPWAEYAEKETAEVQARPVSVRFFEENGVVVLLEMQLEVAPPVGSTVFLTHKNRVSEYEVHRITYHYLAFTPERELACMYVTLRRKSKPL